MSETSGHSHPYSSSITTQTISQRPVPGGKDLRHQHPHDSPTTHASIDERVMDGTNPGDHHYHYSDAPASGRRTVYPPGPAVTTASPPKWPYYQGHYSSPVSDHDHSRPSHILPGPPNVQYPPSQAHWEQPRPTHQHPSPPDQNFPRPHNLPHPGSYGVTPPSYGRQPHSPMEPAAAAPSPPNLYPSSPRISLVSQPPTNGLSSSLPSLPSTPFAASINGHLQHHGGHHSPPQYPPLNSVAPRRTSGSMDFYSSSPLSPGSKPSPLQRIDHPRTSISYPYPTRNGEPYPEEHAYPTSAAPTAPLTLPPPPHLPDAHHPRPAKIEQLSPRQNSQLTNGNLPSRPAEHSDHTGDEYIKREANSRTVSASVSPTAAARNLAPRERRGSVDSVGSSASAKDERKRGPAVFTDNSGRQYFEEDILPPELYKELPPGWQLGTGRKCAGKLLPLAKDGLQVHPEWGLTSAGKARQRLPKACVSCRTKKIKCVDSEGDSAKCQHCVKMKIPCSSDGREEKPSRKNSKKTAGLKRKRESDLEVTIPEFPPLNGVVGGKKRKASEEGRGGAVKRGKSSRANSLSIDPSDGKAFGMGRSAIGSARRPPQPAPAQEERKPFATPSVLGSFVPVNPVSSGSEVARRYPCSNPAGGYDAYNGEETRRLSGAATPTYPSYTPTSPRTTLNDQVVVYTPGARNGNDSGPGTSLVATDTPLCPIPQMLGEDPRHSDLPNRATLEHLVDVYFRYVYSQTYAFLHRKTFEENLDNHRPVLLFSLCALAARFSPEHSNMEEGFTVRARQLVLEHYADYKIDVVQSMVHLGLHDFGSGNGEKAWMFAGMAVRMGAMMYLNFGGKPKDFQTPISKEVARRTYWSYYLMDRLNSYGVARPYLTQDHDCHVQLPCNQPSFNEGKSIYTEHLLGPNPFFPNSGTAYMGAMAYLVRAVGIWGNILKRIHLSELEPPQEQDSEFQRLIESLETWRKTLPSGLQYSNENLAGQIQVGTAGAFVMMHVMWHTAMAYVHRYVRSTSDVGGLTLASGPKDSVIQSIRKTFVHADAVLQIMSHVHERKKEQGEGVVVVNAPFIGKAIFDACEISMIRARKLKGMHNSGAQDQRDRVSIGLTWMEYLKRFWKPMGGLCDELRESYRALEVITPPPPPFERRQRVLSPDSGSATAETSALSFLQEPYGPYLGVSNAMFEMQSDMEAINQPLRPLGNALTVPGFGYHVPEHYYSLAFVSPGSDLYSIAQGEGAFPYLYPPPYGIDMGSGMDPRPTPHGSYESHDVLGPSPLPLMNSQSFGSMNRAQRDVDMDESQPHQQSSIGIPHTGNEDDTDAEDCGPDRDLHHGGVERETLSPSSGKRRVLPSLATMYFHPTAVRCGELVDPSGSESGQESRRPSDVAPLDGIPTPPAPPKPERNRMDLLNLLVTSDDVTQVVSHAVAMQETGADLGTGEAGIMAPDDGTVRGEINTDNSSKDLGSS